MRVPAAPPNYRLFSPLDADWLVVSAEGSPVAGRIAEVIRRARLTTTSLGPTKAIELLRAPVGRVRGAALVQSRPGELPRDLPELLKAAQPEIELVSVAGSWCEGELRTGKPWEGVPRVYWHDFEWWFAETQRGVLGKLKSVPTDEPLVAVDAADYDTAAALGDALAAEGVRTVWWPRFGSPVMCSHADAGLWVGRQLTGLAAERLAAFCATMRGFGAGSAAVLDFPRVDEADLAEKLGASFVFGKPWSAERLAAGLRRLAHGRPTKFAEPLSTQPSNTAWAA